jgi:uncharacterized protein (TIGR03067 family)
MKTFLVTVMVGLAAFVFFSNGAEDAAGVKADLAQLQGEWTMVSGSADGTPMPDLMLPNSKRVCKGNETTITVGGQLFMRAKFVLDPSKTPKTIDYEMIDGPTKGSRQYGIYELKGGTVRFCFASPGAPRPADFSTRAGDGRTISVWKHAQPPAGAAAATK